MDLIQQLAQELQIRPEQAKNAVELLDAGNTVPFVARYRKEATGALDDGQLRTLSQRMAALRQLEQRREDIRRLIGEQGKLTDTLDKQLTQAATLQQVEDLYLPFRPKRRTRAMAAREQGLEPLAGLILSGRVVPQQAAQRFVSEDKGVADIEAALSGARDIVAEQLSDDAPLREVLRRNINQNGVIACKPSKDLDEASPYATYKDFSQPARQIPPHRMLALLRAEREGALKLDLQVEEQLLEKRTLLQLPRAQNEECALQHGMIARDAVKRLILPALERELRKELTEAAQRQAIRVFGINLESVLMGAPVKDRVVLALDPGYRTGNKAAVVDKTGRVLHTGVVYMTLPNHDLEKAKAQVMDWVKRYGVSAIAIGNGTASRETEAAISQWIAPVIDKVQYAVVSEAGASVYSASELAAQEFPDLDVSVRSAVSIARRLQDPMAELIKIDPRSIGVGQYQHDVDPKELSEELDGVLESTVSRVGVFVNTASVPLLSHVAGISRKVAQNVVDYREKNGAFATRKALKKVPGLGERTFEQCAGFLRIVGGEEPLDATGIHPESYPVAKQLLRVMPKEGAQRVDALKTLNVEQTATKLSVGVHTLRDIKDELLRPGRDPREDLPAPLKRAPATALEDLKAGTKVSGTVRSVTDFGAFVDIGIKENALIHVSRMAKQFVKHPSDVLRPGDVVEGTIIEVDVKRKRIALSLIED